MNTSAQQRQQVILRLEPSLVMKVKLKARIQHRSLNGLVESLLSEYVGEDEALPKVKLPDRISEDVLSLCGVIPSDFPQEILEDDDRLAYILSK